MMAEIPGMQTAIYTVWWTKQYGTPQQQYDAELQLQQKYVGTAN